MHAIMPGSYALVRLRPDCTGDGRRVLEPVVDKPGDHGVFGLYKDGSRDRQPVAA
jgi:hypothetical protein